MGMRALVETHDVCFKGERIWRATAALLEVMQDRGWHRVADVVQVGVDAGPLLPKTMESRVSDLVDMGILRRGEYPTMLRMTKLGAVLAEEELGPPRRMASKSELTAQHAEFRRRWRAKAPRHGHVRPRG